MHLHLAFEIIVVNVWLLQRVATNLENLEYSGISLNMENSGNSLGILCNLGKNCNKQSFFSSSFKYLCKVRWWSVILLELMWNDPWWRSLLHLLFVVITYGKVSLWLWKSLENSGNFFSYFVRCDVPAFWSVHSVFFYGFNRGQVISAKFKTNVADAEVRLRPHLRLKIYCHGQECWFEAYSP